MTYYELTIFLKSKKSALCTAVFESKASLQSFVDSLSSELNIIRIGNMIFSKDEFSHAEIKEKTIRG